MTPKSALQTAAGAILIRRARPDDLDSVEWLEDTVFDGDELSRRSLRHYIAAPSAVFLVAEQDGAIIGDAIVAFRRGSRLARLYSLAIHPQMVGRGFGRRLLRRCEGEAVERGATHLRLEVRTDNAAGIGLYRAAGYAEIGRYADYYEDGAGALRFEKPLPAVLPG